MKHLYFVRHGLSVMNKQGILNGRTDSPLTDEGREQARQAGEVAKSLNIDKIVSSPLGRTAETAQIIADQIGYTGTIEHNSLFIERSFGPHEGKPWSPDINLDGFADVESINEVLERAKLGLEFLDRLDADNILVVGHGAIGRALRHCTHPAIPFAGSPRFENGKIVQLF